MLSVLAPVVLLVTLQAAFSAVAVPLTDVEVIRQFVPDDCPCYARNGDVLWIGYRGWLENGTEFGSSAKGEPYGPFTLGQGQVIQGVDRGLLGMCLGETRRLRVPPHLAYGEAGTERIPPNSILNFEYVLERAHPQLTIETKQTEDRLCLSASADSSVIGVDFSAHYAVMEYNKGVNVSWTQLHDTFAEEKFWGPFVLAEKDLIPGLYQALLGMCVGDIRHAVIPPALGYGQGLDDYVPAHATLYFVLELMELKKPGLHIEVLRNGTSGTLKADIGSMLTLHYSAHVVGGNFKPSGTPELVDSSAGREPWGPFVFDEETDMVRGLRRGMRGMRVGEKRRLIVPPELAWGAGVDDFVRANATIIFLLELLEITPDPAIATTAAAKAPIKEL